METKQVIVIRRDLGMRRGKEIAQGAHASMAWLMRRLQSPPGEFYFTEAEQEWCAGRFRKVVCQVPGEAELMDVLRDAARAGVEAHLITDAGLTEFGGVPTITCLAVGPDYENKIDPVTSGLKLY